MESVEGKIIVGVPLYLEQRFYDESQYYPCGRKDTSIYKFPREEGNRIMKIIKRCDGTYDLSLDLSKIGQNKDDIK